jgi:hypothetical protein
MGVMAGLRRRENARIGRRREIIVRVEAIYRNDDIEIEICETDSFGIQSTKCSGLPWDYVARVLVDFVW